MLEGGDSSSEIFQDPLLENKTDDYEYLNDLMIRAVGLAALLQTPNSEEILNIMDKMEEISSGVVIEEVEQFLQKHKHPETLSIPTRLLRGFTEKIKKNEENPHLQRLFSPSKNIKDLSPKLTHRETVRKYRTNEIKTLAELYTGCVLKRYEILTGLANISAIFGTALKIAVGTFAFTTIATSAAISFGTVPVIKASVGLGIYVTAVITSALATKFILLRECANDAVILQEKFEVHYLCLLQQIYFSLHINPTESLKVEDVLNVVFKREKRMNKKELLKIEKEIVSYLSSKNIHDVSDIERKSSSDFTKILFSGAKEWLANNEGVYRTCKLILCIHKLRNLMKNYNVVGFFGDLNQGKSTAIQVIGFKDVHARSYENTERTSLYNYPGTPLCLLDTPGNNDEKEEQCIESRNSYALCNRCIITSAMENWNSNDGLQRIDLFFLDPRKKITFLFTQCDTFICQHIFGFKEEKVVMMPIERFQQICNDVKKLRESFIPADYIFFSAKCLGELDKYEVISGEGLLDRIIEGASLNFIDETEVKNFVKEVYPPQ